MNKSTTAHRDQPGADLPPLAHSVESGIKRIHTSRGSFYKLVAAGEIKTFRIGKRRYVSEAALQDFIRRREAENA